MTFQDFPATAEPSRFLAEYRGHFLSADGRTMDAILRATMEVAAELWVTKERLRVLEERLGSEHGLDLEAIEHTHVIPKSGEARKRRQEYIETIFRHLLMDDVDDPLSVASPEDVQTTMHGNFADKVRGSSLKKEGQTA